MTAAAGDVGAARRRTAGIRLAATYSLGSKVLYLGVQLAAYPLAVRALGTERFAIYALLTATLNWINLVSLGVGPGLTLGIAAAVSGGDSLAQRRLFTNALAPVAALCVAAAVIGAGVIALVEPRALLGVSVPGLAGEVRAGLFLLAALALAQVLLSVVEAAQTGYQEQWVLNRWTAVGNALCFVGLAAAAGAAPTIPMMVAAMSGPAVLTRLVNAVRFASARWGVLRPDLRLIERGALREIYRPGIAFGLVSLGSFISHQYSLVVAARALSPARLAVVAATMNVLLLAAGIATMLTSPLIPAVVDAVAQHDRAWVRRAYARVTIFLSGYAVAVGLAIAFGGSLLLTRWYALAYHEDWRFLPLIGLYFVLLIWEHAHYSVLVGLGRIWPASLQYLARSLVILFLMPFVTRHYGPLGLAALLCVSVALLPLWSYPLMVMGQLRARHPDASSPDGYPPKAVAIG